jgi:hypothetical protein
VIFVHGIDTLKDVFVDIVKNVDTAVISIFFKNVGNQSTIQTILRMLRLCSDISDNV